MKKESIIYAIIALNVKKNVKICFTLSALSAMDFIFRVLSEPPWPFGYNKRSFFLVLIVKVLKMKTYTLTWRHESYFGSTLSCVRFDSLSLVWNWYLPDDKILQFMNLITGSSFSSFSSCRLIKCGRLVARQATYQGV